MSSKPPARKTNAPSQGYTKSKASTGIPTVSTDAPARDGRPTSAGTPQTRGTTRPGTGNMQGRQVVVQKKGGFKMRPMDIAIVLAGLALVAGIVWGGLNASGTKPAVALPQSQNPASAPSAPVVASGPTVDPKSIVRSNFTPVPAGRVAPDFKLPGVDGASYTLNQYKGKVIMLEFFAPWCPHCQNDAPMFNKIDADYKDKVQVLSISATPYGKDYENGDNRAINMSDIAWFRDTYTVPHPMMFDQDLHVADQYGITGYPTVYIVGKDGKVFSKPAYPFTYETLAAEVDKALAGQ